MLNCKHGDTYSQGVVRSRCEMTKCLLADPGETGSELLKSVDARLVACDLNP